MILDFLRYTLNHIIYIININYYKKIRDDVYIKIKILNHFNTNLNQIQNYY